MQISDFKGKHVTVMGIGLHGGGVGVINFFSQAGAKVLATDLRSRGELRESLIALSHLKDIRYVLGQHRENDFINTDIVIKNPAIPEDSKFLKIAKDHNVPIETDIGIFFELCQGTIIGVTGTRGKSTTASLIYQFLKAKHPDAVLAGNIRMSVLEKLSQIKKTTFVVLELSSWQLNGLAPHKKSPQVSVMTNIMADHLNRYSSMEEYIEDKKNIFGFQEGKDFLVLNYEDETLKKLAKEAKSKIYYYSTDAKAIAETEKMPKTNQESRIGAHIAGDNIFFGAGKEKIAQISDIKILGRHNLGNVLAAITVARLFNVPSRTIANALKNFPGLEGRLQIIAEKNGVKYINDTTATTPDATIAAINALTSGQSLVASRLILIAGGADKNLDFSELAKIIVDKVKTIMLISGSANEKLESTIKNEFLQIKKHAPIKKFDNLERAVKAAAKTAKPGDIVLLSPACASFGMFRHEFERGEKFNEAVMALHELSSRA